ncbi:ferredoxin [Jatrophihabitans sp. GAS493]|uniref:ferredoxin n=1 Tax=Jatrophihabitans sp. GAS493 TaxID=1907575 RepID=UPI000BB896D9|nr:ferredoxin [Jatrophihabitans sp. GAS493]SOD72158.1 ferredoxin [Jatrophihabitans sp. GAS493]
MSGQSAGTELRLDGICEGNELCVHAAPDLVVFDEDAGRIEVLVAHPDAEQLPRAQRAVDSCPLRALSLSAPLAQGSTP